MTSPENPSQVFPQTATSQAWHGEPKTPFSAISTLCEKNWDLRQDANLAKSEKHLPQTGDTGDRADSSTLASSGPQYVDKKEVMTTLSDVYRWHIQNAKCLHNRSPEVLQIQNSLTHDFYIYGVRIGPDLQKLQTLVNALQKEREELLRLYGTQCSHVWKKINEIISNAVRLHTLPQGLQYSSNTRQTQDKHPSPMAQTSETQSTEEQRLETIPISHPQRADNIAPAQQSQMIIDSHEATGPPRVPDEAPSVKNTSTEDLSPVSIPRKRQKVTDPANLRFKCNSCEKGFTRRATLKDHEEAEHIKARPFACPTCFKTFSRLKEQKRHEASQHGEKKFTCGPSVPGTLKWGCQKRFAREDSLTTHFCKSGWNCFRPLVEGDDLWIFFSQEVLSGERKDNDFDCNLTSLGCRSEFGNLADLKEHFLSDDGRKCVVDWAEKKFLRPSRSHRSKNEDAMRINDEAPQSSIPRRSSPPIRRISDTPRSLSYDTPSPILSPVSEPAAPVSRSPSPQPLSSRVPRFSRSPPRSRSPRQSRSPYRSRSPVNLRWRRSSRHSRSPLFTPVDESPAPISRVPSSPPLQPQLPLIPEPEASGKLRNSTSHTLVKDTHIGIAHSAQRQSISNSSPAIHSPDIPRISHSSFYSEWKLNNRSHECGGSPGDVFWVTISCPPLQKQDICFSFDSHRTYNTKVRLASNEKSRFCQYDLSTAIPRLEDNTDREIVVGIHLRNDSSGNSDGFVVGKMFYKAKHRSASPSAIHDRSRRRRKPRQRPGKNVRMRWKDSHSLIRP